jgi:RNA polymerase sigma-70 factor, ECF subfamily
MLENAIAPLAAVFLSRWPPEAQTDPLALLEAALEQAFLAGRAAWPQVEVSADQLAAYLGERCDARLTPVAALAALQVTDLFLACACAAGSPAAIAALDAHYLSQLAPAIVKVNASPAFVDEVTQRIRVSLLMGNQDGDAEREPRIGLYRGKATLGRWLVVVATRAAINHGKSEARTMALDEVLEVASFESPELELLRHRHLKDFSQLMKAALRQTIAGLTAEERNLLRWHLAENLSLRKIAVLRGTNVSAISREYARVRAFIKDRLVERLLEATGLSRDELHSLMTVLVSRLSLTSELGVAVPA